MKKIIDLTEVDVFNHLLLLKFNLKLSPNKQLANYIALAYLALAISLLIVPFEFYQIRIIAILGFAVPAQKTLNAIDYKGVYESHSRQRGLGPHVSLLGHVYHILELELVCVFCALDSKTAGSIPDVQ